MRSLFGSTAIKNVLQKYEKPAIWYKRQMKRYMWKTKKILVIRLTANGAYNIGNI